jgi:phosphoribosylpyrophosphate synthetase
MLDTIYLKYQRQERPTLDCRASQLQNYINQFNYDKIRVPYLHGIDIFDNKFNYIDKIWIFRKKNIIHFEENSFIILPDEGAKILIDKKQYYNPAKDFYVDDVNKLVVCVKERNGEMVNTKIPHFNKEAENYIILDDIIAGGVSIINVADLIKEQKPDAKIKVYCIFLMSQYGVDKIKEKHPNIEIIAQYDLR